MQKYDAKTIQDNWQKFWEEEQIFRFDANSDKPLYVVDTPPPYVSADHLHAGHIMSYAQAEFIVRYKRMRGFNVYYPMGFDDNGLPTERFVENKYKVDKSKISRSEFVELCLKETQIGADTYRQLWNSLGISVDWSKTYSTISPVAAKVSQWSLIDLYAKKALYRRAEPILWCVQCRTALSQADLEDEPKEGHLNFIEFAPGAVIATTRPELLPACVALYTNASDKRYSHLVGQQVSVPLFDYKVPVLTSDKVDPAVGTGLMMVCTWGDQEDVEKWKSDNLPMRQLFNEDGHLNELGASYAGLDIEAARGAIVADLQKAGFLSKRQTVERSVNTHERCGTPVEFILSKQWFIKIADLKSTWAKYGEQLKWYPKERVKDYEIWVENLKWDWCISRQRFYGVPLPIWYCAKCEEPILAREQDLPVNPLEDAPPVSTCPACGHGEIIPESDVLDTWATSSLTPMIIRELVEGPIQQKLYPATLRPNAFEIIRTWDFYTIVKSHYHFGALPFTDVMISGHGHDENGRKFSKRLGNYVPAQELVATYGADAIRYWATGAQLGQNLRFNTQEVEMGHKTAVKLWNVGRLLQSHLGTEATGDLEPADIWILGQLNDTITAATDSMENYSYAKARDIVDAFFWSKLADNYIEYIKYRLYSDDAKSKSAAVQTLSRVFRAIVGLYAPILPFVTEEIYQSIYKDAEKILSLHISKWPEPLEYKAQDIAGFDHAMAAIAAVRKHKSEQGISLGQELPEFEFAGELDLAKYGLFVERVGRVGKIKVTKSDK